MLSSRRSDPIRGTNFPSVSMPSLRLSYSSGAFMSQDWVARYMYLEVTSYSRGGSEIETSVKMNGPMPIEYIQFCWQTDFVRLTACASAYHITECQHGCDDWDRDIARMKGSGLLDTLVNAVNHAYCGWRNRLPRSSIFEMSPSFREVAFFPGKYECTTSVQEPLTGMAARRTVL
nr:hypothetical protein CFP56_79477 [Quercus suber]